MLFSFSSSSFHSSFPPPDPDSLLSPSLNIYGVADLANVLYSSPRHCPHASVAHCNHAFYLCVIDNDTLYFSLLSLTLSLSCTCFYFPPSTCECLCATMLSCILVIIAPSTTPPLTLLNSSSLPPFRLFLQSTCDTLRSHSDSLGFTPNMLPRHPTLGSFEEFAC